MDIISKDKVCASVVFTNDCAELELPRAALFLELRSCHFSEIQKTVSRKSTMVPSFNG